MEGCCQINNVVYNCYVARPLPRKVYLILVEGEWKSRFYNHKLCFNTGDIPIRQPFQVTCGP